MPIRSFHELLAWQKAKKLTIFVYGATENFPTAERYGLKSQMRRAATSVAANIAEGFGRVTPRDRERFYILAHGSLRELDSHSQIADNLGFLDEEQSRVLPKMIEESGRLLGGLIKANRILNS